MSSTIQEHLVAQLFPDMSMGEYLDLRADIKAHGLKAPILLWHGQLVDGRHRLRACLEVGVNPQFKEVDCREEDLERLVWSMNAVRRQLTAGQKAMIGALMSEGAKVGRPKKALPGPGAETASNEAISQPQAAKLVGVSRSHVQRAAAVLKEDHALAKEVHDGKMIPCPKRIAKHGNAITRPETGRMSFSARRSKM